MFSLDDLLPYYLIVDAIPRLFDSFGTSVWVVNIDDWFQVHTEQRYSYRGVQDMAVSFANGMRLTYSLNDVIECAKETSIITADFILDSDLTSEYVANYNIELCSLRDIGEAIDDIRKHWDEYYSRPNDWLYYLLCRWWKYCSIRRLGQVAIIERLIERLGRMPKELGRVRIESLERRTVDAVVNKLFGRMKKNQKDGIVERANFILQIANELT